MGKYILCNTFLLRRVQWKRFFSFPHAACLWTPVDVEVKKPIFDIQH